MKIKELLDRVDILSISGDASIDISGVSYDSRKVEKGHLFVAVQGEKMDGHDFINDAINRGAKAVVFEKAAVACMPTARTFVHVKDSRKALALVSGNFFGMPSKRLNVIGVTGTNGKTTTTYIIKSILEAWGKKVGLIGTIQYMIRNEVFEALHTTPEALEFQGLLHRMRESGCTYVVSEVSSHALAQKRVDGSVFKSGVFTNLTRDHLDFHKTMDQYFAAKKRLFTELLDKNAVPVINYDDIWGRKLISLLLGNVYTYGLETGCDIMAAEIDNSFGGLRFRIVMRGRKYSVVSPLTGLPNVYNIMSAAGAAVSLGVPWDVILEGIRNSGSVKGRFERVDAGQGFLAVVDYAHTEDALERLIYTARGMVKGKVITIFGCGGDRDRGKRLKMGAIATRLSDYVIMTSDNPRTEDPESIIREIEAGATRKNYLIEPDRREAIKRAVMMASEGDVLLVAGKGHENYQEIMVIKYKFSDREVLQETIKQLTKNS